MAANRKPKPTAASTEDLRFLKRSSCPALSARSTLYHDLAADAQQVLVRVTECSGGGFLSGEWVSLSAIRTGLQKAKPITTIVLFPLFKGKSVNTPGFLLAVLKAEKLIETLPNKTRHHVLCADRDARVAKLLEEDSTPAKSTSKTSSAKATSAKSKPTKAAPSKPARKKGVDATATDGPILSRLVTPFLTPMVVEQ